MRWAAFDVGGERRVGVVVGAMVHALAPGIDVLGLLGDGGERLTDAGHLALAEPVEVLPLEDVALRTPVAPAVVRRFDAFAEGPLTFAYGNPYAVRGPEDEVGAPPGCEALDFELQVAAVVGRAGSNLTPGEADEHIAGYCLLNGWVDRGSGRSDFAVTVGPYLVTGDELSVRRKGVGFDVAVTASVNGRLYSQANWSDMRHSFAELVAHASAGTVVRPGDVIASGPCPTGSVADLVERYGADAYRWLQPGDEVELWAEELGRMCTRVGPVELDV